MSDSSHKLFLSTRSSASSQQSLFSVSVAATAGAAIVLNSTVATSQTTKADTPDNLTNHSIRIFSIKEFRKNYTPETE